MLEVFGDKGYSRLNHKYSMVEGSILKAPQLSGSFIDNLESLLKEHGIVDQHQKKQKSTTTSSDLGTITKDGDFYHEKLSQEHLDFINENQDKISSNGYLGFVPCPEIAHEHDEWDSKGNATGIKKDL